MLFNKRTTYGIRALLELAAAYPAGQLTSKVISQRTGIPKKFLDQLLLKLLAPGFVQSRKGQKGGYSLGKAPEAIPIEAVLEILNGPLLLADCLRSAHPCSRKSDCAVFSFTKDFQKHMKSYIGSKTLKDLCELKARPAENYSI